MGRPVDILGLFRGADRGESAGFGQAAGDSDRCPGRAGQRYPAVHEACHAGWDKMSVPEVADGTCLWICAAWSYSL